MVSAALNLQMQPISLYIELPCSAALMFSWHKRKRHLYVLTLRTLPGLYQQLNPYTAVYVHTENGIIGDYNHSNKLLWDTSEL